MLYSAVTSTAGCSCQSQPGGRFCLAQHFTGKLLTMLLLCNDLSSQLIASRSFAATTVSAVINLMRIFLLTKVGSFVKKSYMPNMGLEFVKLPWKSGELEALTFANFLFSLHVCIRNRSLIRCMMMSQSQSLSLSAVTHVPFHAFQAQAWMSEVKSTLRTLLSVLHPMLTSRSQIWYTIFVGPFGALGPPAFAGAAADKLRHWREGEVEGREREGPKLLLNQGPSEPCYATGETTFRYHFPRHDVTCRYDIMSWTCWQQLVTKERLNEGTGSSS